MDRMEYVKIAMAGQRIADCANVAYWDEVRVDHHHKEMIEAMDRLAGLLGYQRIPATEAPAIAAE